MLRLVPLTVLLFAALAGPASADLTLTSDGSNVTVTGTDADDAVTVTGDGSTVTFAVPSGTIATADCSGAGASVTCTATAATVTLAGGDDTIRSPAPVTTSFTVVVAAQSGRDELDLSDRTAGVTATPDSVDGSKLDLGGVEDVVGTAHDDNLTGNHLPNRLQSGAGEDRLQGGQGEDRLEGGSGPDTLRDTGGIDIFDGGAGDDAIFAKDEFGEHVDCGEGTDTAEVNDEDSPAACETVSGLTPVYLVPTPSPSPTATATPTPRRAGSLRLRKKGAKLRKRTLRTKGTATCGATACRLKVITKFGTRTRRLAAGKKAAITLKLSKKAAKRLRRGKTRRRKVVIRVRLSAVGATGVTGRVKVTVRA